MMMMAFKMLMMKVISKDNAESGMGGGIQGYEIVDWAKACEKSSR